MNKNEWREHHKAEAKLIMLVLLFVIGVAVGTAYVTFGTLGELRSDYYNLIAEYGVTMKEAADALKTKGAEAIESVDAAAVGEVITQESQEVIVEVADTATAILESVKDRFKKKEE